MSSAGELCRGCGLCCDGTLFTWVVLQPGDDVAALANSNIAVTDQDGAGRFLQPCAAHAGGDCGIYANRPATCRGFQCKTLQRFSAGKLYYNDAADKAVQLRAMKQQLLAAYKAAGFQVSGFAGLKAREEIEAKFKAEQDRGRKKILS